MNADPLMLGERLALLDAEGQRQAGAMERTAFFERRRICPTAGCGGQDTRPIGYIGLNGTVLTDSASDAFFLRGQYASLAFSALIALLVSGAAAFLVVRQILGPIKRLESGAKTLAAGNYATRITQDRTEDLADILREAAETARPQLDALGITLELDTPDSLPVTCDRMRMRQVIDNLLQNAGRYTNAADKVRLGLRHERNDIQLTVAVHTEPKLREATQIPMRLRQDNRQTHTPFNKVVGPQNRALRVAGMQKMPAPCSLRLTLTPFNRIFNLTARFCCTVILLTRSI